MAHGAVPPGTAGSRYEALSGGADRRSVLYLARRYFNLSPAEWDATPWWESHLLIEGLQDQGVIGGGEDRQQHDQAESGTLGPKPIDLTSAPLESIGGFQTRRAG